MEAHPAALGEEGRWHPVWSVGWPLSKSVVRDRGVGQATAAGCEGDQQEVTALAHSATAAS
eukprot:6546660-Prorocentrum_lima.AAC.1